MAEFDDLQESAQALHTALGMVDAIQDHLSKSLRSYYEQQQYALCSVIEKAARLRRQLKKLDVFLDMPKAKLSRPGVLFAMLPQLFELGNAPITWIRLIRDLSSYGIDNTQACDAAERTYRNTRDLLERRRDVLVRVFTKRYASTIDVSQENPSLSGRVTVRVQYQSLLGASEEGKIAQFPEALDMIVRAITESGLDAQTYFQAMASTVFTSVRLLVQRFPELFTRIFGVPVQTEITIIIMPMERRGLVGLFNAVFRKGSGLVFGCDLYGRSMRVYLSFGEIAERLRRRNPEQVAQNISVLLSHELTHALDKRFREIGSMLDRIRIEGLGHFAEALHQPSSLIPNLVPREITLLKVWKSKQELEEDCQKDRGLVYTIGLVMCLGILFLYIKRRHNQIYTPFTDPNELVEVLKDPSLRDTVLDVHRIIHNMTTKIFFDTYQRAVAEGVAPTLFSQELLAEI